MSSSTFAAASSIWSALGGSGDTGASDPASLLNYQLASALSTMGDAQYWEESISPQTIRLSFAKADPSHTSVLLRGMKWLLAAISKGRDVSDFYSHVVKFVASPSLQVRKLVYMYLVQYANHDESTRELSLLSINSFQRGLADAEPLIRALALRVLTCIQLSDITQIQLLAIQKCCADKSPYVRKCAATALAKLAAQCDDSQKVILVERMQHLLDAEDCTMVLTSAIVAFCELCPTKLELLHGSYRKFCHLLTDMDEWGQVLVIEVFSRYARAFFKEPGGWKDGTAERIDSERRVRRTLHGIERNSAASMDSSAAAAPLTSLAHAASQSGVSLPARPVGSAPRKVKRRVVKKGFYSDEEDESTEEEFYADPFSGNPITSISSALRDTNIGRPNADSKTALDEDMELADDHRLLLRSAMPLLKSRNAGVVFAVCSLLYYCGVASVRVRSAMGKALVRIHRAGREIQYVVLSSIRTLVNECPSAFSPFLCDFYVNAMDPPFTRIIKLDILTSLALEPAAIDAVLNELRTYIRHGDKKFACASLRAVGRVVEMARIVFDRHGSKTGNAMKERAEANTIALNCLHGLVTLSQTSDCKLIVGQSVIVMQWILQMLMSDSGKHGDLMNVDDSNRVQDRAMKRIILLLVHSLSAKVGKEQPEDTVEDNDLDEEEPVRTRLACVSVELRPESSASALWILGEVLATTDIDGSALKLDRNGRAKVRVEIIRLAARYFPELSIMEKEQCVHFACKLLVSKASGMTVQANEAPLCELVLSMGRVDVNPDVRDLARYESAMIHAVLGLKHDLDSIEDLPVVNSMLSMEDAKRLYLQRKCACSLLPLEDKYRSHSDKGDAFRFGTLSSLVGHRARSAYIPLPVWAPKDSPDTLRDPQVAPKKENGTLAGSPEVVNGEGGNREEFYDGSSSSDEDDSSSSASSDSLSKSSDDGSSNTDSKRSDDLAHGVITPGRRQILPLQQSNGSSVAQLQRSQPFPELQPHAAHSKAGTMSNAENASDDFSSSSEYESSSSSTGNASSSSNDDKPATADTLIPMGATTSIDFIALHSNNGSAVDDFKGLTLTPTPKLDSTAERDRSAWSQLVRPELANGLSVQSRFLRGSAKAQTAQRMGLAVSPCLVCVEICFENRKDSGPFRRLYLLQKKGKTTSSVIGPLRVVLPPEVNELNPGQKVTVVVAIEFASVSDRDGSLQAKLDVRFGSGSVPIDINPRLGDLLTPVTISTNDFDASINRLHGFQRVESNLPENEELGVLMDRILDAMALTAIGNDKAKVRLVGSLPASSDPVFVMLLANSGKVVVCCDHALAVNTIMQQVKQALQQNR
jgi:AP-3 complex subunit beta